MVLRVCRLVCDSGPHASTAACIMQWEATLLECLALCGFACTLTSRVVCVGSSSTMLRTDDHGAAEDTDGSQNAGGQVPPFPGSASSSRPGTSSNANAKNRSGLQALCGAVLVLISLSTQPAIACYRSEAGGNAGPGENAQPDANSIPEYHLCSSDPPALKVMHCPACRMGVKSDIAAQRGFRNHCALWFDAVADMVRSNARREGGSDGYHSPGTC